MAVSMPESEDYKRFYMHRTGHWLGMDVHDAGQYATRRMARITAGHGIDEPGCYIRADDVAKFLEYWYRIEDDVVVTASDHNILTAAALKPSLT
jgi:Xaa-Pro aminopeptidase